MVKWNDSTPKMPAAHDDGRACGSWNLGSCWEDAGGAYSGVETGRRFRLAGFAIKSVPISVGTSSAFTEI
jgi:hypothetical protein